MKRHISYSTGTSGSLSSTAAVIACGHVASSSAIAPRDRVRAGSVTLAWDTEAGSPTEVTWWLTRDAAGDVGVTDAATTPVVAGQTAATGFVASRLDVPMVTDGTAFYVWAQFDTGTASVVDCTVAWEA